MLRLHYRPGPTCFCQNRTVLAPWLSLGGSGLYIFPKTIRMGGRLNKNNNKQATLSLSPGPALPIPAKPDSVWRGHTRARPRIDFSVPHTVAIYRDLSHFPTPLGSSE